MKITSQPAKPRGVLQGVRDGVLIASATALLAYLLHETTSPRSFTRAFLEDQRRLREAGEELLGTVRQMDARLQTLVEKHEALAQAVSTANASSPKSAAGGRRKSAAKSKNTASRQAGGSAETAAA